MYRLSFGALQRDRALVLQGLLDAFAIAKEKCEPRIMISAYREIGNILGYYPPELKRENRKSAKHPEHPNIMLLTDAELIAQMELGKKAAS
jgi:hypothetical protein